MPKARSVATMRSVMRTAVLGASGFLGVHLVEAAAGEVLALARNVASAPFAARTAVERSACDATEPGGIERALERFRPDVVVLAAAVSRVADAERDPASARRMNAELPARIAAFAAERGARAVLVSTDLVFSGSAAPPGGFTEEHAMAPRGTYASTKAEGERAFLVADPRGLVVRLPLLFGDSRGRGLGASDSVLAALARDERPYLFTDEWRTPLDVRDAAEIVLALAQSDACGIVHAPGPERVTRAEFGARVLAAAGLPPGAVDSGPRAARGAGERPADTSLASLRAGSLLGRRPLALDDALRRTYAAP